MTPPKPVFLERRSYRLRRMMDAVRLVPVLGLALWMVPLMWALPDTAADEAPQQMSAALTYIFGIWALLVLAALALWSITRVTKGDDATDGSD